MKLVSWNVNGIRSAWDKGFRKYVTVTLPDALCLQEVKAVPENVDLGWAVDLGYTAHWNPAQKAGYSGTTTLTKIAAKPLPHGIGMEEHDREGRVLTLEYPDFYLVNVYTPNSKRELLRLEYRMQWDREFLAYVKKLDEVKPVIFCGDLNCAHKEIDLANPKSNRRNAGFTDEERGNFDNIIAAGFIDSFRHFNNQPAQYTWWSFRAGVREKNIGWRIDYFCVSKKIWTRVKHAAIHPEVKGSDHCPVSLELTAG